MTTSAPTLTIQELANIGRETLTFVTDQGQFFFSKILLAYGDGRLEPVRTSQYEGDFDALIETLSYLAAEGPIDWLAHTADGYMMTGDLTEHDPLLRQVLAGEVRLSELFEDDHPHVTEALTIVLVTRTDGVPESNSMCIPYVRRNNKLTWTNPANVKALPDEGRVADALKAAVTLSWEQARFDYSPQFGEEE